MNKLVLEKQIIQAVDFIPRSTVPQGSEANKMKFATKCKQEGRKGPDSDTIIKQLNLKI